MKLIVTIPPCNGPLEEPFVEVSGAYRRSEMPRDGAIRKLLSASKR